MAENFRQDLGSITPYAVAVDNGYEGTEAEYNQAITDLGNIRAEATTLPVGSPATASYEDGVLSLGLPLAEYDDSELQNDMSVLEARMDAFSSLTEGSTTGDAELIDIRVGADGTTYASAGDAVRNQIGDLKSDFDKIANIANLNIYNGDMSNGYVNPSTGAFASSESTKCTDYLSVEGGKYIVSAYNNARNEIFTMAVYDSEKTAIPESAYASGDGRQRLTGYFLLPPTASFVRVSYVNTDVHDTNKLYLLDSVNYNPSVTEVKSLVLNDGTLLSFESIADLEDMIALKSANVYGGTLTDGYINPSTGAFTSGSTTKTTDYLEVVPDMYIVSAYNGAKNEIFILAVYDENKNLIPELVQKSGDGEQRLTGYYKIPSNGKYIRVSYVNENIHMNNKIYTLPTVTYAPTNEYLKSLINDDDKKVPFAELITINDLEDRFNKEFNKSHRFYRKKIVAMGDSVTNGETWFSGVGAFFGRTPINKGVAGSTVSSVGSNGFCTDTRVNDIPTDTELLLVMGGINDWVRNVPLGDKKVTNTDTTTFYGAVNVLIQKLITRIPNAKIICMGATFGTYPNQPNFDDSTGIYNNLGLSTIDYGRAFADMCKLNGIESFVVGEDCGWNTNNISTFITNDGAYLHPNSTGGARMASVINRKIG